MATQNGCDAQSEISPPPINADIVIVGGGIAGLATGLALYRSGIKSLVLERADTLRTSGTSLSLWPNAWRVFDLLGVADQLRSQYPNLHELQLFRDDGTLLQRTQFQGNKHAKYEMRCVERRVLLDALAKPLPEGTIRFNSEVVAIHKTTSTEGCSRLIVELKDGTSIKTKVLIGCDGVHSFVASWMGLANCKEVGRYVLRGMTTFSNPEGHDFDLAFHQFLGQGWRFGFMPVSRSTVYWFLSYRKRLEASLDPQSLINEALNITRGIPTKIVELIKNSQPDTVVQGSVYIRWLWPTIGGNLFVKGSVTLAGDAMHCMSPDIGQGACLSLEDAVILARRLAQVLQNTTSNLVDEMGQLQEMQVAEKIERGLEMYCKERRGRVFSLQLLSYTMGGLMEADWWGPRFLRYFVLARIPLASWGFVNHTQFDCGVLPDPRSPT